MSFLAKPPCNNFSKWFVTSDIHTYVVLEAVLIKTPRVCSISHMKFASGPLLIKVNFDSMQVIRSKIGGGRSFEDEHSFVRLW